MKEALTDLSAFMEGSCPVAFGPGALALLHAHGAAHGMELPTEYADLSVLSHDLWREVKEQTLAAFLGALGKAAPQGGALETARGTAALLASVLPELDLRQARELPLFHALDQQDTKTKRRTYHIIIIAKNQPGLVNLYRLVSYAHLEHLRKVPRIPRSLLHLNRQGLIVGSACEAGELFQSVLKGEPEEKLARVAGMYDFLEIQPIANNAFLTRNGRVADEEGLRDLNRKIVALGDALHKPVWPRGTCTS